MFVSSGLRHTFSSCDQSSFPSQKSIKPFGMKTTEMQRNILEKLLQFKRARESAVIA